ncbi:hypothetical protein H920_09683 [Fukomys damarensis]|uniref:Uncharacterized protein n=1 Tax=Fukomys damarensis TaxID=885580 RepID=A0A091E118_FUKDA|nr:hypothetical protein H920_09683 [Fukomys damarensis]
MTALRGGGLGPFVAQTSPRAQHLGDSGLGAAFESAACVSNSVQCPIPAAELPDHNYSEGGGNRQRGALALRRAPGHSLHRTGQGCNSRDNVQEPRSYGRKAAVEPCPR